MTYRSEYFCCLYEKVIIASWQHSITIYKSGQRCVVFTQHCSMELLFVPINVTRFVWTILQELSRLQKKAAWINKNARYLLRALWHHISDNRSSIKKVRVNYIDTRFCKFADFHKIKPFSISHTKHNFWCIAPYFCCFKRLLLCIIWHHIFVP